ncbi:MAG: sensor histidine kinase, partial [Pseudomonadota bacterium]|nr:sensor histidine kinase [Pseudomonadota bacterium]
MQARRPTPHSLTSVLGWLHRVFDATATWVSQLSWWKFFLFAALALIAGKILQDELFSGGGEEVVVRADKKPNKKDGESNILIDESGIRFSARPKSKHGATTVPPELPEPAAPAAPAGATELPA